MRRDFTYHRKGREEKLLQREGFLCLKSHWSGRKHWLPKVAYGWSDVLNSYTLWNSTAVHLIVRAFGAILHMSSASHVLDSKTRFSVYLAHGALVMVICPLVDSSPVGLFAGLGLVPSDPELGPVGTREYGTPGPEADDGGIFVACAHGAPVPVGGIAAAVAAAAVG